MHVLFICSRNQWRSPTAEKIYSTDSRFDVRSAGLAASAIRRVNSKLLAWADIIFVMEHEHKRMLQENFREDITGKNVVVLDIPDEYSYMDEELIDMIRNGVEAMVGQ